MNIALDVSPLFGQSSFRGVGFYTKNLLNFLTKQKNLKVFQFQEGKVPRDADLIHYPYFSPFVSTLPRQSIKKFVVTVHDLIPLVFPTHYPPGLKGKIMYKIQKTRLRKASAILTDSQCSKEDIIKFIGCPREKVEVVYLASANDVKKVIDQKILKRIAEKFDLPQNFVLYVGDVNYNKNLPGLVKACRLIKMPLVIVGKQATSKNFDINHVENKPLVELNNLASMKNDVIRTGFIQESELAALYSLASVYCQPSFYEGFGLQILEAFVCGCPVVTSSISSLPEVAGDAAVLVNPYEMNSIANGMQSLVEDPKLRDRMVKAGFEQAKRFSWEKTIQETIKVYEKILEK